MIGNFYHSSIIVHQFSIINSYFNRISCKFAPHFKNRIMEFFFIAIILFGIVAVFMAIGRVATPRKRLHDHDDH